MPQAIAATVVLLVLFAGAFAAIFAQRSRTQEARRSPRWQVVTLSSVAAALAVVVLTVYLYA